jgi:hypothetical protein
MIRNLRQLRFPRELRIPEESVEGVGLLLELLAPPSRGSQPDIVDLVVEVATRAWEIARETARVGDESLRFLRRAVEGLEIALQRHEVEVQDFTGKEFNFRENWDRVVSSPREKARPYIARMMAPRIFYRGELLRGGVPVVEDREEQT